MALVVILAVLAIKAIDVAYFVELERAYKIIDCCCEGSIRCKANVPEMLVQSLDAAQLEPSELRSQVK